jgi:hypothetical protein
MAAARELYRVIAALRPESATAGALAARGWLADRALFVPTSRWHVEIALDVRDGPAPADYNDRVDSRFHVDIYSEEWGFFFCHGGRASWIRITDVVFVHGRDDYGLIARVPALREVGMLLRALELQHKLGFRREHALVRTNLTGAEHTIRRWVEAL